MRSTTATAVLAAAMLVLGVVGATPALASDGSLSVSASQDDGGGATVTVSHNNTSADGASVTVSTVEENDSYSGTGTYTADNGTVSLPAYDGNGSVELSITASYDNETASTTLTLGADNESENNEFGQSISTFASSLNKSNLSVPPGALISQFALENNPGNAPSHAGPPDFVTGDDGNETNESDRGPPGHAGPPGDDDGNESDGGQGPPDDAGPPGDDEGDDDDNGNGPPEDAGPPGDDDDEDEADDSDE